MTLSDSHVHSDNPPDGESSVIELCESAIIKGFSYITVTDHCEIESFYKDRYNIGYRQSYVEVKKAEAIFNNQIIVRAGIELGQATVDTVIADAVTSLPYDMILGSMHCMPGMEDFAFVKYENTDVHKLFASYLSELLNLVNWGNFDSLAHLTYPLRYINGEQGYNLDTEDFGEELEKLLREIIKREIALEINTSGLRQQLKKTMPDRFCLTLYKSLGGQLLTLGSDSHRAEDVGAGIVQGLELAKEVGFSKYCIYKNRKPEFVTI